MARIETQNYDKDGNRRAISTGDFKGFSVGYRRRSKVVVVATKWSTGTRHFVMTPADARCLRDSLDAAIKGAGGEDDLLVETGSICQ